MISRRRTFVATLLGCSVFIWNGSVQGQATPGAEVSASVTLDAAGAASNSASLPPPAPLGAASAQVPVSNSAPAGLPPLPPAGAAAMPALPAATTVPATTGMAVPEVSTFTTVPAAPTLSDVPPVVIPGAEAPLPDVVEPAKEIAPADSAPLVSTASGGPLLPVIPNDDIVAIEQAPLPAVTPASPLIPAPSVAESVNQKRQVTTLPGSGGDTNYVNATIGGPDGPPRPLITPPTVIDPVPGHDIGKPYPALQAVMPQPQATPLRWDEPGSALGTPNPPHTLNYYLSKSLRENPDLAAANPNPDRAEVIVLRGGQEFQGLILERGDLWKVELLNGTVITIPGSKVSHVRKLLAVPTSTPTARRVVFPPQPLYREEMTN